MDDLGFYKVIKNVFPSGGGRQKKTARREKEAIWKDEQFFSPVEEIRDQEVGHPLEPPEDSAALLTFLS